MILSNQKLCLTKTYASSRKSTASIMIQINIISQSKHELQVKQSEQISGINSSAKPNFQYSMNSTKCTFQMIHYYNYQKIKSTTSVTIQTYKNHNQTRTTSHTEQVTKTNSLTQPHFQHFTKKLKSTKCAFELMCIITKLIQQLQ